MSMNETMKKVLSILLCLCMLVQNAPVMAFAATADNLCEHHPEHTAECGYVAAVEGSPCTHVHDEACGYAEAVEEVLCACTETDDTGALLHTEGCGYVAGVAGSDCTHAHDEACGYVEAAAEVPCGFVCEESHGEESSEESAPVCDCGANAEGTHATTCAVYVAPENPVCLCAEKCTEANIWCDVCGFDYTACGGTDTPTDYADSSNNLENLVLDISKGSITLVDGRFSGYDAESTQYINMSYSGTVTITGTDTDTTNTITVNSGTHNIVLSGVNISATSAAAFSIAAGATVNLTLTGDNVLLSGEGEAGLAVPEGATLVITNASTGSLTVTGGAGAAGIGGGKGEICGSVTINGGTVTATGGQFGNNYGGGAGIGGGANTASRPAAGGTITINGGMVTATGGAGFGALGSGAGIGGGGGSQNTFAGTCGNVTINGGTVIAAAGSGTVVGFGIGRGGRNHPSNPNTGTITINGGTVTATGIDASAIIINDGTVTAKECISASGPGTQTVTINGGTVTATDGIIASGTNVGTITITGGTVTATEGIIASGNYSQAITITGGDVKASATNPQPQDANGNALVPVTITLENADDDDSIYLLLDSDGNKIDYNTSNAKLLYDYDNEAYKLYIYLPVTDTPSVASVIQGDYQYIAGEWSGDQDSGYSATFTQGDRYDYVDIRMDSEVSTLQFEYNFVRAWYGDKKLGTFTSYGNTDDDMLTVTATHVDGETDLELGCYPNYLQLNQGESIDIYVVYFYSGLVFANANYDSYTPAGTISVKVGDYVIAELPMEIKLVKMEPSMIPPTAETLTYNGQAQALVTAGETEEFAEEMQYSLDNENWSTAIPTGTDAGEYTVYYKVPGNDWFTEAAPVSMEVSIQAKEVTEPTFADISLRSTEPLAIDFKLMDGDTEIPASEYTASCSSTAAGTATITITDKDGGNYIVSGTTTVVYCDHSGNTTTPTDLGDGTHSFTCSSCGGTVIEDHAIISATGKCVCSLEMAAASLTNGETVTYYGSADEAFNAAKTATSGTVTILKDAETTQEHSIMSYPDVSLVVNPGVTLTVNQYLYMAGNISGGGTINASGSGYLTTYSNCRISDITIGCEASSGGTIESGTFTDSVNNRGTITGGTFRGSVSNTGNGKIQGGTFYGTVTSWDQYSPGTQEITAGVFNGTVDNCGGSITGGTFNSKLINRDDSMTVVDPITGDLNEMVYPGTITNTATPTTFTLGENFTIENSGTINCTSHIWKDGVCRLCAHTCDHSGAKPTDLGDGTHSFTCTVCGTTVIEDHAIISATGKCVCSLEMAAAKIVSGDTTTYYASLPEALAVGGDVYALADYADDFTIPYSVTFYGGEYSFGGAVTNEGTIESGTFNSTVTNRCYIKGGTFSSTVDNYGNIYDGTFNSAVTNGDTIYGGTFNDAVANDVYSLIDNTSFAESFTLGENFSIVNNGTVNCTYHIWKDGVCRLCAYTCDHSGNTAKPTDNGNGKHSYTCTVCGTTVIEDHSGSKATCITLAECDACESEYGTVDKTNHAANTNTDTWTDNGDGTHSLICTACGEAVRSSAHSLNRDTGKCYLCNTDAAVAKTSANGTLYWDNINEAVAQANLHDDVTITLLQNTTTKKRLDFKKSATLDLNGKTLSCASNFSDAQDTMVAVTADSAKLTIIDSAGGGKLDGTGSERVLVVGNPAIGGAVDHTSSAQISGGTISGRVRMLSGTSMTVSGGTVESSKFDTIQMYTNTTLTVTGGQIINTYRYTGSAIANSNGGTVIISGGTVSAPGTNCYAIYTLKSTGRTEISGGTISGGKYDIYADSQSTVELTGGTFPGGISVNWQKTLNACLGDGFSYWAVVDGKDTMLVDVADDAASITDYGDITVKATCDHSGNTAKPTDLGDGTHSFTCTVCGTTVIEDHAMVSTTGKCVCGLEMAAASLTIGETVTYYSSGDEVFAAIESQTYEGAAKILLISDCSLSADAGSSFRERTLPAKTMVLDLNGKTLSGPDYVYMPSGTNLTVMDSQGDGVFLAKLRTAVDTGASLTLESGTLQNARSSRYPTLAVWGNFTMTGGKVYQPGDWHAVDVQSGGYAEISGGTVESANFVAICLLGGSAKLTGGTYAGGLSDSSGDLDLSVHTGYKIVASDGTVVDKNQSKVSEDTFTVEICDSHTGGEATCVSGKLCENCGSEYGEKNADAHSFDSATGKCSHCGTDLAVASLDDGSVTTYYADADDVFAAVKNLSSGTVTILKDTTLDTDTTLYSYTGSLVVNEGATLTLNRHLYFRSSISGGGTIDGSDSLAIYTGGTLTGITVSSGFRNYGTVTGGTFDCDVKNSGNGTITGGIFRKTVDNSNGGKIQGGTFYGAVTNKKESTTGAATISGGIFYGTVDNVGKGSITGGTFHSKLINRSDDTYGAAIITNTATPTTFTLGENFTIENSATINCTSHIWKDGACRLCAYECDHAGSTHETGTDLGDGTHSFACTVCNGTGTEAHAIISTTGKCICGLDMAVASLTDGETVTYYSSADEAFIAAKTATSGVVTILKDAETTQQHFITSNPDVSLVVNPGVTLTVNQYLYMAGNISGGGTIGGTGTYSLVYAGARSEISNITIGCKFTLDGTVVSGTFQNTVKIQGGTVEGGTFHAAVTNEFGTINGGDFYGAVNNETMDCDYYPTINGGTFHAAVTNIGGSVTGGTFYATLTNEDYAGEFTQSGTITNTATPTTFTLGENFAIVNSSTINCTSHIWKDGTCRLCAYTCDHSGSQHQTASDLGDGTHSFTCTVCNGTGTEAHSGGTATCIKRAECDLCGGEHGELAAHTPDANGKCTVEGCGYQYAAKVGETFYESIHKALRAAEGSTGCTLTLLDNITLNVTSNTASYVNKGTFTLDLNGKTFSSNAGTLSVLGSANLTIKDSVGGGKIVSTGSNAIYQTGGKLTIESGTFEGEFDGVFMSYDSTVTVKGGTFIGSRAMITGFGSDCKIDLTNIDPTGFTLKNNGSGSFTPALPEGYGMVDSDGKLLTYLDAEQSATVHKHEYTLWVDVEGTQHQKVCTCGLVDSSTLGNHVTEKQENQPTCLRGAICDLCGIAYGEMLEHVMDRTTGKCGNGCEKDMAVASVTVGETVTYYETMAEAQTNWVDGTTLTLLANGTVASDGATAKIYFSTGTRILDLNGHTLNGSIELNGGSLTVTDDNAQPGTLTGSLTVYSGRLTVNGGNYGDVNAFEGTAQIYGGSFGALTCLNGYPSAFMPKGYYIYGSDGKVVTAYATLGGGMYQAKNVTVRKGADLTENAVITVGDVIYNASEQRSTVTVRVGGARLAEGTDYTLAYSRAGENPTDLTNAGEITVTVTGMGVYTGSKTATYTIGKAQPEAAHFSYMLPTDAVYNGKKHEAAVSAADGVVGMGQITIEYCGFDDLPMEEAPVNAGEAYDYYKVYVSVAEGTNYTASDSIYIGRFRIDRYEIKSTDISLHAETLNDRGEMPYTGEPLTPDVVVKCGDMVLVEGTHYTVDYSENINVTRRARVYVTGIGNCTGETYVSFEIVKANAAVTTAPTAKDLTYTGEAQALVNAGTTADGKLVYSLSENGEYSESIPTGLDAGKYTVWYYVDGDDNHSDSTKTPVEVTIAKAKATITVDTTTIHVTYGETVTLPTATTNFGTVVCDKTADDLVSAGTYTVTYTVAGTANFDGDTKTVTVIVDQKAVAEPTVSGTYTYTGKEQTVTLTGVESYMTVASENKGTNAGNYEVEITLDSNYKWADGSDGKVQWSIAKAKAEIRVNTDPITVTYGQTVTLPTATTNFGTAVCDKTAEDLVNAGTYTVTYIVAGTANFAGDTESITVIVDVKTITVTADALSKTYGDADPKLTYTVDGMVGNDQLTGELKRVAGENVGDYAIEQNTLTAGDNYRLIYTGANLTIHAKAITEADVELKGSLIYTGEEQTQLITVTEGITYEVSGNKATDAGQYTLTVTGTGNYTGTCERTWTIAKAAQTITLEESLELSCTETVQLAAQAQGTLTFASSDKTIVTVDANGKLTAKKADSVVITVSAAETRNYLAAQATCQVTVGHAYEAVVTAPTCEDKGYTTYTCHCGDSYVADYVDAKGHDYDDGVITTQPGCETEGVKTFTCGNDATHTYTEKVAAKGHDYKTVVTAPTCEDKGYTTYTCHCGDSYVADYVDAKGHDYDDGVITTQPGCETEGVKTFTCGNDKTHTYTEKVAAKGHDYKAVVTAPTCEDKGYTTYTCHCGDSYVADYVDAKGHDYDDGVITTQPGCETEGVKTFTCGNDATHTYTEKVAAKGHAYKAAVTAPTCEDKGYTTYTCSCGDSYVADYVDAKGHDYDDGVITTQPGCETEGIKTFTCGNDATHTYTESIPAKGHSFGAWTTTQQATCTTKGQERRNCSGCDHYETRATAYADHIYRDAMDPTCEICGARREICVETIPMHRLYNRVTGEHFYTGSVEERDTLVNLGWNYEGVAWNAPVEFGDPVYRYYNPNTGDHHYTMSEDEGENLKAAGWNYEGVAWNSASSEHLPIYRLYNPNATIGTHHYTGSAEERDNLVAVGWKYEGIAWYGLLH